MNSAEPGPAGVPKAERARLKVACCLFVTVAALLSAFGGSSARAEVRLSNEAVGANYRVDVMSWWDIPFRSVVRQKFDFSCGSAAVATLLTHHYGRKTTENDSFKAMWDSGDQAVIRKVGFSLFEMKTYLGQLGYRAEGYRLTRAQLVRLQRPIIVLLVTKGFRHFVVVKGVRNGRVLVGDPMLGLGEYSFADFAKVWNGIGLAIVEAPSTFAPAYNLAGDWGPWSSAPMESGGLRVALSEITNDLPPDYQITPMIVVDAHVGSIK